MSKAFIQKPAPYFEGEAVMEDGSFKKIKLTDYKGIFCYVTEIYLMKSYSLINVLIEPTNHSCVFLYWP